MKYDDFINQGFDDWLKKSKPSASAAKSVLSPPSNAKNAMSGAATPSLGGGNKGNRHMLVEFWLININSVLRHIKNKEALYGFLAFEALAQNDTVYTYMQTAA